MKRLNFKCTLLTDVIISAQTATEGEHQSLSFIPGSNFLGILAGAIYKSNPKDSYSLFHSGKVRFGDAHIVYDNIRSFQIPFSWYYPKGGSLTENQNYMLNFMSNENFKPVVASGIQLKQARDGYFTANGSESKYLSPVKTFSQKSAHNSENRRSLESQMFGYEALQKGSEWLFYIDVDDDLIEGNSTILEKIKTLTGTKRLGRSKTAEFGSAAIEYIPKINEDVKTQDITPKEIELENRTVVNKEVTYEKKNYNLVLLYAESRLAFRNDETGQPTFTPTAQQLGIPIKANILWERSQIRTGVYAPWNWKRDSRDEDRVFIEKGSVFVVDISDLSEPFTDEIIHQGVGLYKTDGFGKLLVNPAFLDFDPKTGLLNLQLGKIEPVEPAKEADELPADPNSISTDSLSVSPSEKITSTETTLIKWIKQQNDFDKVLKMVDVFIKNHAHKYSKVTNSQWGNIRSFANQATNKSHLISLLFEASTDDFQGGFLMHGVELKQWADGKELLKKSIKETPDKVVLQFVEKLAARMQKRGGEK